MWQSDENMNMTTFSVGGGRSIVENVEIRILLKLARKR